MSRVRRTATGKVVDVATFDPDEMVQRFKERRRSEEAPDAPVEGEGRRHFIEQSKLDFQDFAMLGDAEVSLDEGILTLRIDLRPPDQR